MKFSMDSKDASFYIMFGIRKLERVMRYFFLMLINVHCTLRSHLSSTIFHLILIAVPTYSKQFYLQKICKYLLSL